MARASSPNAVLRGLVSIAAWWGPLLGIGPVRAGAGEPSGPAPGAALFTEVAREVGLDFVHFNGMTGAWYMNEHMGPGVGLFDYDDDGDLDVYLVQGSALGPGKAGSTAAAGAASPRHRLFRNDLSVGADGRRSLAFTDVTVASGIDVRGYGMGVAAGDVNNDGAVDLFVTQYGSNRLLENRGDGTFADVTKRAGLESSAWSAGATFFDFDRDGWLDLYVTNYLAFDVADNHECFSASGARNYCAPQQYSAQRDRLYHNRGDGSFQDVSLRSGIARELAPGLGAIATDLTGDAWVDIYVTNDGTPNFLWVNQRDGTFRNDALLAGLALDEDGRPEASMGVDAGDFDGDGDEDLFVTNLTGETHTLYVNLGKGLFEDRTLSAGIGAPSLPYTGFGTGWIDFDNDGWLDLLAVNGAVYTIEALARAKDPFPLHQKPLLLRNRGDATFEDWTAKAGPALARSAVSRGTAFGDVDNDGDIDVVIGDNNGPARLLRNETGNRSHWIGLRLVEKTGKRDALGARVTVVPEEGPPLARRARADGSYCSANDPRVLVGLGQRGRIRSVRVIWPSGTIEEWDALPVDRWSTVREGTGKAPE